MSPENGLVSQEIKSDVTGDTNLLKVKRAEKIDRSSIDFLKVLEDRSCVFTCPYAEIRIPQDYFDHGISEVIGNKLETFCLFNIKVWKSEDIDKEKPEEFFFKYRNKIVTSPNNIKTERDESGNKITVLCYNEGATFCESVDLKADKDVARRMLDLMTLGYLPNIISYEEIASYWTEVNVSNGVNLKSMSRTSIELIVSEMCRDPKDYSRAYRFRLRDEPNFNRKKWKLINIRQLPKYNSLFASLTSGDPRGNLVSMISRRRKGVEQKGSPVEDVIM